MIQLGFDIITAEDEHLCIILAHAYLITNGSYFSYELYMPISMVDPFLNTKNYKEINIPV